MLGSIWFWFCPLFQYLTRKWCTWKWSMWFLRVSFRNSTSGGFILINIAFYCISYTLFKKRIFVGQNHRYIYQLFLCNRVVIHSFQQLQFWVHGPFLNHGQIEHLAREWFAFVHHQICAKNRFLTGNFLDQACEEPGFGY